MAYLTGGYVSTGNPRGREAMEEYAGLDSLSGDKDP